MNEIYVRTLPLPVHVKAFTVPDAHDDKVDLPLPTEHGQQAPKTLGADVGNDVADKQNTHKGSFLAAFGGGRTGPRIRRRRWKTPPQCGGDVDEVDRGGRPG